MVKTMLICKPFFYYKEPFAHCKVYMYVKVSSFPQ